ncbi:SMP-30/gluconolactonase/LRE family protein, partial [Thermodesulfobacteriota bacterium]
ELFPGETQKIEHDKEMFNACPRPVNHNSLSLHGLDLKQQSSGQYHLYVINHGEREAIEVFNIDAKGTKPAISWAGCVILPKEVMANSVTILPDGGFLTTNYFDPTNPNSRMELIQGKISGAVYEWHPGGEVKAIKGTELSGPNGITLSPDNEWVYLTAFGTREIIRFNRTKRPVTMERVKVEITPDNIRWGDDGMLYTVGNNHVPPEECQNPPCRAGWSVYSVHPDSLKLKRIFSIDQTAALQNGTTALVAGNEIWVGTFAGDMIAYFPKP